MQLPEELREELKKPLGELVPDSEITREELSKHIEDDSFVISVGDATVERLLSLGITPSLQIIDEQEKRKKRDTPTADNVKTSVTCINPAAEITQESMQMIKQASLLPGPVRILVIGEEDLLVIPVCIHAPEKAVVFYGQPDEGLVVVKITDEVRNKAQNLFDSMIKRE